MIDVPARVKDALKSGDYRKNVKITVPGVDMREVVTNVVSGDDLPSFMGMSSMIFDDHHQLIGWDIEFWNDSSFTIDESYSKIRIYADVPFDYLTFNGTRYDAEGDKTYATIPTPSTGEYAAYSLKVYYTSNDPDYNPNIQPRRFDCYDYVDWFDNDNLVAESVKFDERMCSDTELKFGLCEGTSVEFQYFDLPNIRGEHISISIDVQYKDTDGTLAWYEIPMGQYDVDECSRQASTGIIKATAYNKLKSTYLDQKANKLIDNILDQYPGQSTNLYVVLQKLLNGYGISDIGEVVMRLGSFAIERSIEAHGISYPGTNFKYFVICDVVMKFHAPSDWTSEKFLRFMINAGNIAYIAGRGTDPYDRDIFPSHFPYNEYMYIYHNDSYFSLQDDRADMVKFRDFMNSNHSYALYFRGYVEISQNNGATITKLPLIVNYNEKSAHVWWGDYDNVIDTGFITGVDTSVFREGWNGATITIHIPCRLIPEFYVELPEEPPYPPACYDVTNLIGDNIKNEINDYLFLKTAIDYGNGIYAQNMDGMNATVITKSEIDAITDNITLRDLQSAVFETNCQYGKLNRVTDIFTGVELNNGGLFPRDNLYPNDGLFPLGTLEAGYPAMYSKLWADEGNVRTFRYLIITYKGTETVEGQTQEVEKKLQRTVNANGTDDYNMSDNWLFKNLVWSDADVATYADAMVAKMQNMSWFPFEMWCAGLPYLEAGDAIEIAMQQGTYKSYVLRRNLNGIQNLQDEMINGTLDIF